MGLGVMAAVGFTVGKGAVVAAAALAVNGGITGAAVGAAQALSSSERISSREGRG